MIKKMCCMRLRTAGIVIGWLGVVGATLGAILFSVLLINVYQSEDYNPTDLYDDYDLIYINSHKESLMQHYGFELGCCLYQMVISGLLVFGSVKSRHLMLLPWMISTGLGIIVVILSVCVDLYATALYSDMPATIGLILLIKAVFLAISIWVYLAVHSLFKEIKFEKRNASTHVPPIPTYQHKIYPTNV